MKNILFGDLANQVRVPLDTEVTKMGAKIWNLHWRCSKPLVTHDQNRN